MIIRVQSSEGTKRIDVLPTESSKDLFEKVLHAFQLEPTGFCLYRTTTRTKENEIKSSRKSLQNSKIQHGDMIYLVGKKKSPNTNDELSKPGTSTTSNISSSHSSASSSSNKASQGQKYGSKSDSTVIEDEVDKILSESDGRVDRKRNESLCRHLGNSKCIHCCALDPWDETIMKENNIKHLSFHTYLRKLLSGVDKGKFTYMEDINCQIKPGCKDHPPWPQGICSKCQPSAITLNQQTFRHIDNVTFENPHLVERFINYWRTTGSQRVGLLYGKHQPHFDVPLGIKASVAAIYEPPQESSKDHVKLLPDSKKEVVDEIARGLGLICIGWIFTDLVPLDGSAGTVKYIRNSDSYFLSAHEVITAAHLQNLHPNPCKLAPSGCYGSKLATVIVTGDKTNQVHMEGYQVSNQCQALVRDNCLIPTRDLPELAYVRESTAKQYVPDVYFKEKDQYGNEVVRLGRPLPVEYLLLDCPVSTPNEPVYTFTHRQDGFPVENRMVEGHLQDFSSLVSYGKSFKEGEFVEMIKDFHLLIFLATMDMLPLRDHLAPLLSAIKTGDLDAIERWRATEEWGTVDQLIKASEVSDINGISGHGASSSKSSNSLNSSAPSTTWICPYCTFNNQTASENCEICHLPR